VWRDVFEALAAAGGPPAEVLIDSTHVKAHRSAAGGKGGLDDAIINYDQALTKYPNMAASLFGRAVAWARKGDKAKSDADIAAAIKINPDVRTEFENCGIKL